MPRRESNPLNAAHCNERRFFAVRAHPGVDSRAQCLRRHWESLLDVSTRSVAGGRLEGRDFWTGSPGEGTVARGKRIHRLGRDWIDGRLPAAPVPARLGLVRVGEAVGCGADQTEVTLRRWAVSKVQRTVNFTPRVALPHRRSHTALVAVRRRYERTTLPPPNLDWREATSFSLYLRCHRIGHLFPTMETPRGRVVFPVPR